MTQPNWFQFVLQNPIRRVTYHAVGHAGRGGFGEVWIGLSDLVLPVAIKIVRPTSDPVRDFITWYNEQEIFLKCLTHNHIVTTYDQFIDGGNLVIVMEKAEGSLSDFLTRIGPLHPALVCAVGMQMCLALQHIHSLDVIHRDITTRNILWFPNGIFKLSDFGIAKKTVSPNDFARTLIGQWNVIPPELIVAGYSSSQSDIYQLGLVLLELLDGKQPIPSTLPSNQIIQMVKDGVPRQRAEALIPTVGGLANIISIMLRRRDVYRYSDSGAVYSDLCAEFERIGRAQDFATWLVKRQQNPLPPPTLPRI